MGRRQTALSPHLDQVTEAELEAQVPPHAQDNDLTIEVAALEQSVNTQEPSHRAAFNPSERWRIAGRPICTRARKIVYFLQDMEQEGELRTAPSWKAHQLTGDRKGTWSLFVTKNWRLTFQIDQDEVEIIDLDYEDYH